MRPPTGIRTSVLLAAAWLVPFSVLVPPAAADEPDQDPRLAACLAPGIAEEVARRDALNALIPYRPGMDPEAAEARVRELATQYGPRHELLFPDLMALGLALDERGAHDRAGDAYRDALLIVRANDGLYSTDQIPVLEKLIESRAAAGEWRPASDGWDLLYWISRRAYAPDDPRVLPLLTRVRKWHIEAYNKDDGRVLDYHFNQAERLYKDALELLEQCTGDRRLAYCHFHAACCPDAPAGTFCPADAPHRSSSGFQSPP